MASVGFCHRLAFDQFAFNLDLVGARIEPAREIDEHLDGDLAHLVMRQHESGERRMRELRDRPVVESDDGNIIGNLVSLFVEGLDATKRHHVVGAEDRVRRVIQFHELKGAVIAGGWLPVAPANERSIEGNVVARQGLFCNP